MLPLYRNTRFAIQKPLRIELCYEFCINIVNISIVTNPVFSVYNIYILPFF